jgi:hypothetical protein
MKKFKLFNILDEEENKRVINLLKKIFKYEKKNIKLIKIKKIIRIKNIICISFINTNNKNWIIIHIPEEYIYNSNWFNKYKNEVKIRNDIINKIDKIK